MSSSQSPFPLALLGFKVVRKGALRGFSTVRLGKSRTARDVPVLISHGRAWAALPAKAQIDAAGTALRDEKNKIKYVAILEWSDSETTNRFSDAVVECVRRDYPDALDVEV